MFLLNAANVRKILSSVIVLIIVIGSIMPSYAESFEERITSLEKRIAHLEFLLSNGNKTILTDEPIYEYSDEDGEAKVYFAGIENINRVILVHYYVENNYNEDVKLWAPSLWINDGEFGGAIDGEGSISIPANSSKEGYFKFNLNKDELSKVDFSTIYLFEVGYAFSAPKGTYQPSGSRRMIRDISIITGIIPSPIPSPVPTSVPTPEPTAAPTPSPTATPVLTPQAYTISFDANGGSGSMEVQHFEKDTVQNLNENQFVRDGYVFNNWNTVIDGSGIELSDGSGVKVSADITLYAQWKVAELVIVSTAAPTPTVTPTPKPTDIPKSTATPTPKPTAKPTAMVPPALAYEELAKGSKGDAVVELQNRLNELGYSVGTADGDYGGNTKSAIEAFQADNGLDVTGIADSKTLELLFYEENLYLIHSDEGYGFCNAKGETIIPCQWVEAVPFSSGMARVRQEKDGYWGYINEEGKLVVPCDWELAYDFESGYAKAVYRTGRDAQTTVFDKNGNQVVPLGDYYNGSLTEGVFLWQEDYDSPINALDLNTGKTLFKIDASFADNTEFSDGLLRLVDYDNDRYIYVDKKGKIKISIVDDYSYHNFHDGLAMAYNSDKNRIGFTNEKGTLVIPFEWSPDDSEDFSEGFAVVRNGYHEGPYGYIDTSGELLTKLEYLNAKSFSEGLAAVQGKNNMWGFINKQGEVVVDFLYDKVENFQNGYSLVTAGKDRYYIKPDGGIAFAFEVGADINSYSVPEKKADVTVTPKPTATPKPADKYSESECKNIALAYMKEHISPYLKNPASLQITTVSGGKTEGSEYLFVINYTAMNSFGGYTPGTYYCKVDYMTGKVTMGGTI